MNSSQGPFSSGSVPTNPCAILILASICSRFTEPRFPENGRFCHPDACLASGTYYTSPAELSVEPVQMFRLNSSSLLWHFWFEKWREENHRLSYAFLKEDEILFICHCLLTQSHPAFPQMEWNQNLDVHRICSE